MRLCSPGPHWGAEAAACQTSKAKVEEAWPAEEQAMGGSYIQAARGVHCSECGQWSVAGVGLSAQGWSGRANDLDNGLWGGGLSSGTQGEGSSVGRGPIAYLSHVLGLWTTPPPNTHLGHILWVLSHRAKELLGGWEVQIPKVAQRIRVCAWELSCGNLLQELPFKFSGHWARFHQGDAGNRGRGRGSGALTRYLPHFAHYCPSFSLPLLLLPSFGGWDVPKAGRSSGARD